MRTLVVMPACSLRRPLSAWNEHKLHQVLAGIETLKVCEVEGRSKAFILRGLYGFRRNEGLALL